jgi:hypothetical protein
MEQGDGKGDEQQAPPNSAGLRFTGLQAPQAGPGTSSSAGQRMGTTVRFHSDLTPMKDEHRRRASLPMGPFSPGGVGRRVGEAEFEGGDILNLGVVLLLQRAGR